MPDFPDLRIFLWIFLKMNSVFPSPGSGFLVICSIGAGKAINLSAKFGRQRIIFFKYFFGK